MSLDQFEANSSTTNMQDHCLSRQQHKQAQHSLRQTQALQPQQPDGTDAQAHHHLQRPMAGSSAAMNQSKPVKALLNNFVENNNNNTKTVLSSLRFNFGGDSIVTTNSKYIPAQNSSTKDSFAKYGSFKVGITGASEQSMRDHSGPVLGQRPLKDHQPNLKRERALRRGRNSWPQLPQIETDFADSRDHKEPRKQFNQWSTRARNKKGGSKASQRVSYNKLDTSQRIHHFDNAKNSKHKFYNQMSEFESTVINQNVSDGATANENVCIQASSQSKLDSQPPALQDNVGKQQQAQNKSIERESREASGFFTSTFDERTVKLMQIGQSDLNAVTNQQCSLGSNANSKILHEQPSSENSSKNLNTSKKEVFEIQDRKKSTALESLVDPQANALKTYSENEVLTLKDDINFQSSKRILANSSSYLPDEDDDHQGDEDDDDDDDDKYGTARKMASQIAVLNLSDSSGSNNQEDSFRFNRDKQAPHRHRYTFNQGHFQKPEGQKKRKERVFKQTSGSKKDDIKLNDNFIADGQGSLNAEKQTQSIFIMNLDFLDDDAEVIQQQQQQITPRQYSKPLESNTFFKLGTQSRSFARNIQKTVPSQQSGCDEVGDFFNENYSEKELSDDDYQSLEAAAVTSIVDWQHQFKEERETSLKIKTELGEVADFGAGDHAQPHHFFNTLPDHPDLIEDEDTVLPADCVKNIDKLLVSFDQQQQLLDNDIDKINVSLKSSEENKIIKENGCDLVDLKSSPMMRPRAYRAAPSESPPGLDTAQQVHQSKRDKDKTKKKEESFEEEELSHHEIVLKLLAKLQNEQKNPTQLKVQQNIQSNINYYDENVSQEVQIQQQAAEQQMKMQVMAQNQQQQQHQHVQQQYMMNGTDNYSNQAVQPQPIHQNMTMVGSQHLSMQQPFAFQLNQCIPEMPPANTMPQQQYSGQVQDFTPQYLGLLATNQQQYVQQSSMQQVPDMQSQLPVLNQMQVSVYLNELLYQQQAQLNQMATLYNQPNLPPMVNDLDSWIGSLPLQFQYALLTDEQYLHRQFQITQLMKLQQQQYQMLQMPPNQQQYQFHFGVDQAQFGFNNGYQVQMQVPNPHLLQFGQSMNGLPGVLQQNPLFMGGNQQSMQNLGVFASDVNNFHALGVAVNAHPQQLGNINTDGTSHNNWNSMLQFNLNYNSEAQQPSSLLDNSGQMTMSQSWNKSQNIQPPALKIQKSAFQPTASYAKTLIQNANNSSSNNGADFSFSMQCMPSPTFNGSSSSKQIPDSYLNLANMAPGAEKPLQSIFSGHLYSTNNGSSSSPAASCTAADELSPFGNKRGTSGDSSAGAQRASRASANRLVQMTVNIEKMYDKITKYKRAREKCLEQIRSNKPQVDYIKVKPVVVGAATMAADGNAADMAVNHMQFVDDSYNFNNNNNNNSYTNKSNTNLHQLTSNQQNDIIYQDYYNEIDIFEQDSCSKQQESQYQPKKGGNGDNGGGDLSIYAQQHSFGTGAGNRSPSLIDAGMPSDINHKLLSTNKVNDYSGLSKKNDANFDEDEFDQLFNSRNEKMKLHWNRKNSMKKQQKDDNNEEIGLGLGGEYVLKKNQIIISPENEKYKIVQYLGQGTFGQVVKCINVEKGTQHAIKIIKNKTEFILQGMVEIKILEKLNDNQNRTHFEKQHLIKMEDYFVFRDYLCIVFELLQCSLYETIQQTERGLPLGQVRDYTRQILEALVTCKDSNLIHCDLKPENILTAKDGLNVKLIDFGSAAFNGHQVYTYIQSRYYRAPEVLMGCLKYPMQQSYFNGGQQHLNGGSSNTPTPGYDQSIDMWSLACTAIEMFIKIPIFPGKYDYDQLLKILEFCGCPSQQMILASQNRDRFFCFNLPQQRYVFKTFYEFVVTMVPPNMQNKVEQPINYHHYYNFRQLLESHYRCQLHRDKYQQHLMYQRQIAEQTENHCFIPFTFEYTYQDQVQIDQFIDFVQQILQVDPSKRLTPLQALSHPFITGHNLPLPYIPASDLQLRRFRQANLLQSHQNDGSNSSRSQFKLDDMHIAPSKRESPLAVCETQRSISAPLPKRFSVWEFFKKIEQTNGYESFRPPIYALPENIFYGNCCENTISEFYQESKIRFQLHQDENNLADIELQKQLLKSHQFCDFDFNGVQGKFYNNLFESQTNYSNNQNLTSQVSEQYDGKSQNISVLEICRQQSILQLKEDKNVKQPKVTETEQYIRELLQRDVINNVQIEADRRVKLRRSMLQEEESKQREDDWDFSEEIVKSWDQQMRDGRYGNSNKPVQKNSFNIFEENLNFHNQNNNKKGSLIFMKIDKERSNSSDTIKKQQAQQPEISLFSNNPIIKEEVNYSNDNVSSQISSIKSEELKKHGEKKPEIIHKKNKFTSQINQLSGNNGSQDNHFGSLLPKSDLKISNFAENIFDQSKNTNKNNQVLTKRTGRKKKKKQSNKMGKLKTPIKKEEFPDFEDNSLDKNIMGGYFGSKQVVERSQLGCQSQCDPIMTNHISKKSASAFADHECSCDVLSHSGSDIDTEHDTDYGKRGYMKKTGSEINVGHEDGCCLTNFKGSTSLRNKTLSNNNSFENPPDYYLDKLSGSIKEIAAGEDDHSTENRGIVCLRDKRMKVNKKKM